MNFADLPNNVEMEKAVLAALLLKNGAVIPKVSSILSVDDFYRTEHQIIFKTILKLFASGLPIDVLSLLEELRRTKEIEKTGYELIYALANAGYTTAYAEHHASIVKEKSELRQLIRLAENKTCCRHRCFFSIFFVLFATFFQCSKIFGFCRFLRPSLSA